MDRNREARRVSLAASNGLSRRRHRSSSLRDSPEDDGPVELQETTRLRDRKKDRDRERDRDRDREKDRERDRISGRSKRRRGERLMHGSNREDGERDDSSDEESVNDDEYEDDDDAVGVAGSSMRMLPPNPSSLSSSSMSNHHHRKSFPPPAKVFRAAPTTINTTAAVTPWKAPDEMIGVSVPRKARSASTKRSHECWVSSGSGVGSELTHRQASTSPVRSSGPAMLASISASPAAPASPPSSSNASVKKKMKPNGPKQKPPKSSSKPNSSAQDEIEFEIAEVLYGLLRQPQAPSKQEIVGNDSTKFDSRENHNKSTSDAKSRVSSPISNSQSTVPQSSSIPQSNSSSSAAPMSTIAPKRKRPRPVKYEDEHPANFPARNSSILSTAKIDIDQPAKIESSPNIEKNLGSAAENGGVSCDLLASQAAPATTEAQLQEVVKPENHPSSDSKPMTAESECRDLGEPKEEPRSPMKESTPGLRFDDGSESLTANKANVMASEIDSQREEKFQIDLMAPPPSRSSPERDSEIDFVAVDPKSMVTNGETEKKPMMVKEDEKALKTGKENMNVEPEEKKTKVTGEEVESQKPIVNEERNIDLQLDLEKADRDSATVTVSRNKLLQHVQKQQQPNIEKIAPQSSSLPLPMSMTGWPGGLPHMGYMAPLQGVVSMDGSAVSSAALQPPHLIFSQPRPKRCATHCYIARNIHCHQQIIRMNPFWPPAGAPALQYGAKASNMNVVPSTDLHAVRGGNSVEKGQGLAIFPGPAGKDKNSQAANSVDAAQRKQILLQQALPPGAHSNILQGPTFIFPMNQQQAAAAAAASVRPGSLKSSPAAGSVASSSSSSSASISATASAVAGATAMSFNYPNFPGNETQYLAILQNGAYPIIPAHVGPTTAYRGTHPQAMPLFNGSFYSSRMVHPSQLQQQQQPSTQTQQSQQGHQNPSISSGSSSSQKHLQNQQHKPHGSAGSGNLQGFPCPKTQPPQSLPNHQRQVMQNQNVTHQARQLESELGGEDSPSTADSRVSRANMSIYGQNLMPIHPANFALMNPTPMGSAHSASGNTGEKKSQQPQTQASKAGVEPLASQTFAMSFAPINGTTASPGLDISSLAQNHALLQSLPEAARHGYHHFIAAAQATQQKNYRVSEEGKSGGNDTSNVEEERKAMAGGKTPLSAGQSIVFSRPDLTDSPVSTMPVNNVVDSSARNLNLGSTPARTSGSFMSATIGTVNAPSMQQQMQRNQQQQQQQQWNQQIFQFQKQQQFAAAAAAAASTRSKTPATSNGSVYSDHISSSSSAATKFPNALSAFPQNLVQSSSSPAQSPQWKSSVRTTTSQVPSSSLTSSSSTLKNLPQQQGRTQQSSSHISFAANQKSSASPQGQPNPSSNQSSSPPLVVGSPTTSISKSAGGSPRTSTSNKGGQSSQQSKNSASVPVQKSSPVGGRNIPSILGYPHNSSSNPGTKPQLSHQQQLTKNAPQQQLIYTNAFMQAQAQHVANSTNVASAASGFYLHLQRHRSEQQPQPHGAPATSSTGMLSLCHPVTLASTSTTDPAKAVAAAAAANNMKGGGLPPQGLIHAQFAAVQPSGKPHQILPAGLPYVHPVPTAVQVKPAEQKQPAGE